VDDRYGRSSTVVATPQSAINWHARVRAPTTGDAMRKGVVHNAYRPR